MVIIYSLLTTMLICLIEFIVVKISYICIDWIYTIKENKKGEENKMNNKEIKKEIGDIIKDAFPFYTSYKIKIEKDYYDVMVFYYYMGQLTTYIQKVPKRNSIVEKDFDGFKICLTNIKKDLISYPKNKTQQKFLRKI